MLLVYLVWLKVLNWLSIVIVDVVRFSLISFVVGCGDSCIVCVEWFINMWLFLVLKFLSEWLSGFWFKILLRFVVILSKYICDVVWV